MTTGSVRNFWSRRRRRRQDWAPLCGAKVGSNFFSILFSFKKGRLPAWVRQEAGGIIFLILILGQGFNWLLKLLEYYVNIVLAF